MDELAQARAFALEISEHLFLAAECLARNALRKEKKMEPARFKIGDFVVSKAQMKAIEIANKSDAAASETNKWRRNLSHPSVPVVFQIIEILEQRCYGGFQRHYDCRGAGPENVTEPFIRFVEIELEPAPE